MIGMFGKGFFKAIIVRVMKSIEENSKDDLWKLFCFKTSAPSGRATYGWLYGFPGLQKWVGERKFRKLRKKEMAVETEEFEASLRWHRKDLRGNKKVITDAMPQVVEAAREHPAELVFRTLTKGEDLTCHDGKALFAVDHPAHIEGETFSNIITQVGTSDDAFRSTLDAVELLFRSYTKSNGMGVFDMAKELAMHVLHPLAYNANFRRILEKEKKEDNTDNEYKGRAKHNAVALFDRLSPGSYYILITNRAMKALIFQVTEELKAKFNTEDWEKHALLNFLADASWNVGPGMPELAIKVNVVES